MRQQRREAREHQEAPGGKWVVRRRIPVESTPRRSTAVGVVLARPRLAGDEGGSAELGDAGRDLALHLPTLAVRTRRATLVPEPLVLVSRLYPWQGLQDAREDLGGLGRSQGQWQVGVLFLRHACSAMRQLPGGLVTGTLDGGDVGGNGEQRDAGQQHGGGDAGGAHVHASGRDGPRTVPS